MPFLYEDPDSEEKFLKLRILNNCLSDKDELKARNEGILRSVRATQESLPPLPNIDQVPDITQFYTGTSIFITGGTGFMGKALIEKLLYACPDIKTIYLLMRPKKGVIPENRLKTFYNDNAFIRLRAAQPDFLKKIVIIKGDCMEKFLGISEEDKQLLVENVDIVFHVAASVRFDDSLKKAVLMNTRGTYYIVELSKQMPKLKVFLHVSTSYCNTDKKVIEEKFYPAQADWRSIIRMAEEMDERTLIILQPKILAHFPNTYTFTKSLSENIIEEAQSIIPTVVFRPSIVVSAHDEPVPGWVDNLNGPIGLMVGTGLGLIRVFLMKREVAADWVEVDIATNAMITAAWYQAHNPPERKKESIIFNGCTSNLEQVTYDSLVHNLITLVRIYPINRVMWYPFVIMTTKPRLYWVLFLVLHLIPGMLIDLILKSMDHKLSLMKIYRKAYFANVALQYFMFNEWEFRNGHFLHLALVQKEVDRRKYWIGFAEHDTINTMRQNLFGLKQYIMKESTNYSVTVPKAQSKMRKLYLFHCLVILVLGFATLYCFWKSRGFLKNRFLDSISFDMPEVEI